MSEKVEGVPAEIVASSSRVSTGAGAVKAVIISTLGGTAHKPSRLRPV